MLREYVPHGYGSGGAQFQCIGVLVILHVSDTGHEKASCKSRDWNVSRSWKMSITHRPGYFIL